MDEKHPQDSASDLEAELLLLKELPRPRPSHPPQRWPWIAATIIFGLLSASLLLRSQHCRVQKDGKLWKDSDFCTCLTKSSGLRKRFCLETNFFFFES